MEDDDPESSDYEYKSDHGCPAIDIEKELFNKALLMKWKWRIVNDTCALCRVKDGKNIVFWFSMRAGNQTLKEVFPELFVA